MSYETIPIVGPGLEARVEKERDLLRIFLSPLMGDSERAHLDRVDPTRHIKSDTVRYAFQACRSLQDQGAEINPVTVDGFIKTYGLPKNLAMTKQELSAMIADSPPASTQVSKIVDDVITVDAYSRLAMSDRRLADLREQAMNLTAIGMPSDDIDDQIAQEERERTELGTVASDFINALQPAHQVKVEHLGWLVDEILPAGILANLIGSGGSGKSTVAMNMACSVATGRDLFGRMVFRPGKVIYIPSEDHAGTMARLEAWCDFHDVPMDEVGENLIIFDTVNYPIKLKRAGDIPKLNQAIKTIGIDPQLIVHDTWSAVSGLENENDNSEVGELATELSRFSQELGCTNLVLHHTAKAAKGTDDGRGAVALANSSRLVLFIDKDRMMKTGKSNNVAHINPVRLEIVVVDGIIKVEGQTDQPSTAVKEIIGTSKGDETCKEKVFDLINRTIGSDRSGIATGVILDGLGADYSKTTIYEGIKQLSEEGRIIKTPKGITNFLRLADMDDPEFELNF